MFRKFKNYLLQKKRRQMIIASEIERKKINFVYRFLLQHHEARLRDKVDLPAFYYAADDMKFVIRKNRLNEAYKYAREFYKKQFEKETGVQIG